jgi:hypothetical protein
VSWELATSAWPFAQRRALQAAHEIAYRGLKPSLPAASPQWLVDLCVGCWKDEPIARPPFTEILKRLELAVRETPLPTERTTRVTFAADS